MLRNKISQPDFYFNLLMKTEDSPTICSCALIGYPLEVPDLVAPLAMT